MDDNANDILGLIVLFICMRSERSIFFQSHTIASGMDRCDHVTSRLSTESICNLAHNQDTAVTRQFEL
jgi:hypothetical protein